MLQRHQQSTAAKVIANGLLKFWSPQVSRLKSPFYVGEGWILTGQTPKCSVIATAPSEAYTLARDCVERLTGAGNTSVKLIQRDLQICAFERRHLHGFVNTLYRPAERERDRRIRPIVRGVGTIRASFRL